jgi:hypothetical protein
MKRSEVLKHAIAFALSKLRFKRAPLGIPEHARIEMADEVVKELQRFGGWKELDEDAGNVATPPSRIPGPYTTNRTIKIRIARGVV